MKKLLLLGLACTFMFGVSGCMGENKAGTSNVEIEGSIDNLSEKDKKLVDEMVQYAKEHYDENFEPYKFFLSKKGFNTDTSSSYLLLDNGEGVKVVMSNRNDEENIYGMNYYNILFSQLLKEKFEQYKTFEGELFVYVRSTDFLGISKEVMIKEFDKLLHGASRVAVRVKLNEEFNDTNLVQLNNFYNEVIKFNDKTTFVVTTLGDPELTKEYFGYFTYYDLKYTWEEFDPSITQKIGTGLGEPLSLEEFKKLIVEVK